LAVKREALLTSCVIDVLHELNDVGSMEFLAGLWVRRDLQNRQDFFRKFRILLLASHMRIVTFPKMQCCSAKKCPEIPDKVLAHERTLFRLAE
jgi:hypothetical protein